MATYRADLTQNVNPAMANPAYLERAAQLEGAAAETMGRATAQIISTVGKTVFDAYTGYKEAGLQGELEKSVSQLDSDVAAAKDTAPKERFERDINALPNLIADYEQAEIASGAAPEEARFQALAYRGEQESAILTRFREEQARVMAARDNVPERYNEFMLRSESILKKYIANTPGLAANFRQIAQEVTGKSNLDLYSTARLYEDVNAIEKQNEAAAKARAKERETLQNAYINDRKAGGVAETQAIREFNTFDEDTLLGLAQTSAAAAEAKANADNALKLGGQNVANFVTLKGFEFDNAIINKMGKVQAQLAQFGVTRQQLATGSVPENIKADPKFQDAVRNATTEILTSLDTMYVQANNQIATYIKSNPTDAAVARQAKADLDSWYDSTKKYYAANGESPLLSLVSSGDFTQTLQQRLTVVNSISNALQIPPDVVTTLLQQDTVAQGQVRTKYPKAAAQIDYLQRLISAATKGVPDSEWIELLKTSDTYMKEGVNEVPTTVRDASAALLNIEQTSKTLGNKILNNQPITQEDVYKVVTGGMATPANSDIYIRVQPSVVATAIVKLPEPEKQLLIERTKMQGEQFVYGEGQHGNAAKTEYNKLAQQDPLPFSRAREILFKDNSGLSQLSVSLISVPQPGLTPNQQAMFKDRVRTDIKPNKLNSMLTQVDRVLNIRSSITGEPIQQLRRDFMQTFMQEGMPSDNRTRPVVESFKDQTSGATSNTEETFSMADVAEFAEQRGISVEDAENQLRAGGITIGE